ncbi:hypothetical protein ACFIQF_11575 [Comamonas sp. J-3]|uniref:hypothetical protein n=1 Tax=Comamonas trifloxystrobinivorans TaxID=3350256 RepID=UPI00372A4C68
MQILEFLYTNSAGESKARTLDNWAEEGHYIVGNDITVKGAPRTFRKDRITQYLNGCEALLKAPFQAPPPKPDKAAPEASKPQILFTGFGAAHRAELEALCTAAGLAVVKTVTQKLVFMCGGPNAGPSKVSKARMQGCYIVGEADLPMLLEFGVLPDHIFD